MRQSNLHNLIDGRNEAKAILRRDQVLLFLFRDTAYTARIAAGGDRNCHLPTAKKEIAGRGTGVIERAVRVLRYNPVTRVSGLFLID